MQPSPISTAVAGTGPHDPTSGANPDGLSTVLSGDRMFVYGGWNSDRVWELDLPSATWTEHIACGDVPAARLHHAADAYQGHMLVTGGERMTPPARLDSHVLSMPYFEMSCDTFEWMAIECFGALPMARSHHSAKVMGDSLIVFGGKPSDGRPLTATALAEAKRNGFYDIHILQIVSRTWRRVEMYDPSSPMVWGHASATFRGSFLLVHGGFDVSSPEVATSPFAPGGGSSVDTAPIAQLSNVVHILKLDNMTWMRYTPEKGEAAPVARAFHNGFSHGAELIIFGGMTIDFAGRAINVNDCWVWSVEYGRWSRLEFCIPTWPSKALIGGIHNNQLLVTPQLSSTFFLDMARRGVGWQRVQCDAAGRPVAHGREAPSSEQETRSEGRSRHRSHSPRSEAGASAATTLQSMMAGPASYRSASKGDEYLAEVDTLRDEVARLKSQLEAKNRKPPPPVEEIFEASYPASGDGHDRGSGRPSRAAHEHPRKMQHWADVARSASPRDEFVLPGEPDNDHPYQPPPQYEAAPSTAAPTSPVMSQSAPAAGGHPPSLPPPRTDQNATGRSPPSSPRAAARGAFPISPTAARRRQPTFADRSSTLQSLAQYQDLRHQRASLATKRREKLQALQQRLAQLEASTLERSEKAELVRAIRAEAKKLEAAADAAAQAEAREMRTPTAPGYDATGGIATEDAPSYRQQQEYDEQPPIRVSPRLARAREQRKASRATSSSRPLLFDSNTPATSTAAAATSASGLGVEEAHSFPSAARVDEREQPSAAGDARSNSPLASYWDELQQALGQQPTIRPHRL